MASDQALQRYLEGRFSDDDVMRCTGLTFRAWRELLRTRALNTVSVGRGRGRTRVCDAVNFKRAATIAALNWAGLSLPVAGQIAFFWPFHTMLFTVCDPRTILFPRSEDPKAGLPPMLAQPRVEWFNPGEPARAEPGSDWLIEIYDGRFVGALYGNEDRRIIFGHLLDEGTRFVAWAPSHIKSCVIGTKVEELSRDCVVAHRFVDFVAQYEDPRRMLSSELKVLGYRYERRQIGGDPLRQVAEDAGHNPVVRITVNATFAVRIAIRRYLGIEPIEPASRRGPQRNR